MVFEHGIKASYLLHRFESSEAEGSFSTLFDDIIERSNSLAFAQPFTFTTKVGRFTAGFEHTVTHTVEHRLLQFADRILEQ